MLRWIGIVLMTTVSQGQTDKQTEIINRVHRELISLRTKLSSSVGVELSARSVI